MRTAILLGFMALTEPISYYVGHKMPEQVTAFVACTLGVMMLMDVVDFLRGK